MPVLFLLPVFFSKTFYGNPPAVSPDPLGPEPLQREGSLSTLPLCFHLCPHPALGLADSGMGVGWVWMGVGWRTLPRAKGQRVRVKEGKARRPFRRTRILTHPHLGSGWHWGRQGANRKWWPPDAQAQGFDRCEEVIKTTTRQRHWVSDSDMNPHQGAGLDQRPVFLPHINPEKDSQDRGW